MEAGWIHPRALSSDVLCPIRALRWTPPVVSSPSKPSDPTIKTTSTAHHLTPPHLLRFSSRSRDTYDERMRNGLFGLTQQSWSFVKDIKPGMPLFPYNLSEKKFQGVFEAVSTHPKHRARAPAPHLVALSFWDKPPRRASAAWELFRSFSCSGAPFGRGRIPRRRRGRDTRTDEPDGVPRGRRQPLRVRRRRVLRGRVGVRRGTSCS